MGVLQVNFFLHPLIAINGKSLNTRYYNEGGGAVSVFKVNFCTQYTSFRRILDILKNCSNLSFKIFHFKNNVTLPVPLC